MYHDPNVIYWRKQRTAREVARGDNAHEAGRKFVAAIERSRDNDLHRSHLTDAQRLRLEPDFKPELKIRYGQKSEPASAPATSDSAWWRAGYGMNLAMPEELSHLTSHQAAKLGYTPKADQPS